MRAATFVQQLCKSCRTCFKFYCMFYFTCDRSLSAGRLAVDGQLAISVWIARVHSSLYDPRSIGSEPNSAEHYRPHPDEFCLVDVTVVVDVERADKLTRLRLIAAQSLTDDIHQLIRTQNSVVVRVQGVKTPPDVLVATSQTRHTIEPLSDTRNW